MRPRGVDVPDQALQGDQITPKSSVKARNIVPSFWISKSRYCISGGPTSLKVQVSATLDKHQVAISTSESKLTESPDAPYVTRSFLGLLLWLRLVHLYLKGCSL